jgi:hypothetical protein
MRQVEYLNKINDVQALGYNGEQFRFPQNDLKTLPDSSSL